ncbi:MAG: hypothetical protein IPL39_01405 [Opitutaceae bacterium]|nr:hypothetical protein [Opitutaceae bacterium]
MRKILVTTLALFSVISAFAVTDKKTVLDAIAVIESSHDGEAIGDAIPIVMKFADESPDVVLFVSAEVAPWVFEDLKLSKEQKEVVESLLLASYAAGSIKHQLAIGKLDKNPYEGWLLALTKYEELKQKIQFVSPGMEKLQKLQKSGKLKSFGEELIRKKK